MDYQIWLEMCFVMSNKNIVSWNTIISCYSCNGLPDISFSPFTQISQNGLYPNAFSITSVFTAVSSIAALQKGKTLHRYQIRHEITTDVQTFWFGKKRAKFIQGYERLRDSA